MTSIPPEIILHIVREFHGKHIIKVVAKYIKQSFSVWGGYYYYYDTYEVPEMHIGDLRAAKSLRLVSRDYASAYGPIYMWVNIGGDFMRSAITTILKFSARLSRQYLLIIACRVETERMYARTNDINNHGAQHCRDAAFYIHSNAETFRKCPILILDPPRVHDLLKTWRDNDVLRYNGIFNSRVDFDAEM